MDRSALDRLLTLLDQWDGSDLHLKVGEPPRVRIGGALRQALAEPTCSPADTERIAHEIMNEAAARRFAHEKEAAFTYAVSGVCRFRVRAFAQRGTVALTFHRVSAHSGSIEELGLPSIVRTLAESASGLVLVVGPHDSGKSTTLSAMVDHINRVRACTIVTIEDPIEYLYDDVFSSITQREVGVDTESTAVAVRSALRQDADVIVVGDANDAETFSGAMSAARSGQLVLMGVESVDATDAISHVVGAFSPSRELQVRDALARSLNAVVTLRPRAPGDGGTRTPIVDVLLVDPEVSRAIALSTPRELPAVLGSPSAP